MPIPDDVANPLVYRFTVTPATANGDLTIVIPDTTFILDIVENRFAVPVTLRSGLVFDSIMPTATLTPVDGISSGDRINVNTVEFNAKFSMKHPNATLIPSEVIVTPASARSGLEIIVGDAVATANGDDATAATYPITIQRIDETSQTDLPIMVHIIENAVTDPAGNANSASNSFAITFDTSKPGVSIASSNSTAPDFVSIASGQSTGVLKFDVTFTEPIREFNWDDIRLTGSAVDSASPTIVASKIANKPGSDTEYTFAISFDQMHEGRLDVYIPRDTIHDLAGNTNIEATPGPISFNIDSKTRLTGDVFMPDTVLSDDNTIPANPEPISFQIVLYGLGVTLSTLSITDIIISGDALDTGVLSPELLPDGTFHFTPTINTRGILNITIPADTVSDNEGNSNDLIQQIFVFGPPTISVVSTPIESSSTGGGKTTPLLASQMIMYNTCSQNQDAIVRVLTFNLPRIDTIHANLYTSEFVSYGVDVTAQVPVSTYLNNVNPNHVYTIFDAKLPAGTQKFFVTVFDVENVRWTTSTLVDLTDSTASSLHSSECANTIYPHELRDPNAQFVSPIEPLALETLPVPIEQLRTKMLNEPALVIEEDETDVMPSTSIDQPASQPTVVSIPSDTGDDTQTPQSPTRTPASVPVTGDDNDNSGTSTTTVDSPTVQSPNTNSPSLPTDVITPSIPVSTKETLGIDDTPQPSLPSAVPLVVSTNVSQIDVDNNNNSPPPPPPPQPSSDRAVIPPPPTTSYKDPMDTPPVTESKMSPDTTIVVPESSESDKNPGTSNILLRWINELFGWIGFS